MKKWYPVTEKQKGIQTAYALIIIPAEQPVLCNMEHPFGGLKILDKYHDKRSDLIGEVKFEAWW